MTQAPDLPLPSYWSPSRLLGLSAAAWCLLLLVALRHVHVHGGSIWWLLHGGEGVGLVLFTLLAGLAFAQTVRQASSLPLRFLVGGGIALVALATLAPPFLSSDVFDYLARGRVEVLGNNPYTTPVSALADDPRMAPFAALSEWNDWCMPYGPFTAKLQWLFALLDSPWLGAYLWKAMTAAAHVAAGWALFVTMRSLHGERDARRGLVLWLWNPWLLLESCGSGHNDALPALLLAVMVHGIATARMASATTSFGLATLLKHGHSPFGPLLLAHAVRTGRGRQFAAGCVPVAAVVALAWIGYFQDEGALGVLSRQADVARISLPGLAALAFGSIGSSIVSGCGLAIVLLLLWLGIQRAKDPAAVGRFGVLVLVAFLLLCSPMLSPWYHLWWLPLFALANQPVITRVVELLAWLGPFSYLVYATTRSFGFDHQVWQWLLVGVWPALLLALDWRGVTGIQRPKPAGAADGDEG